MHLEHLRLRRYFSGITLNLIRQYYNGRRCGGVLEFDSVLAWLPIEKTEIDIKELWWNPEYRLISIIYDSIMVFAKDADDYLTMEYYGGDKGKIIFHMDVQTGNILETDKNEKTKYIIYNQR